MGVAEFSLVLGRYAAGVRAYRGLFTHHGLDIARATILDHW
jgi:hypothetical protein